MAARRKGATRRTTAREERGLDLRAVRGRFPVLTRRLRGTPLVYLDSASTSQRPGEMLDAMGDYYRKENGNSHQEVHELGARSKELDDAARKAVARHIGAAKKEEVIWTRGTTEGINIIARTWAEENVERGDNVVLTVSEHYSNLIPWQQLAKRVGCELRFIDVDAAGRLRYDQLDALVDRRTKLITFSHVSNVLGIVNDVGPIVDAARGVRAKVLLDAAQSMPHLRIDVQSLGIDFMAFSAHKFGGPFGTGALWAKDELLEKMTPNQFGGGTAEEVTLKRHRFKPHPESFEAGTGNPSASIGFQKAVELIEELGTDTVARYMAELNQYGLERLRAVAGLTLLGAGEGEPRVPLFTFTYKGLDGEDLAKRLGRRGIAVAGGKLHAQPVLKRYGLDSATRASCWVYNTTREIDKLAEALESIRG
jgi:cysteine desulfurase / selenocysteine lyase